MSPRLGVSPAALAMARILGGALVFAAAHMLLGAPRVAGLRDHLELAALALFGVVLNQALFLSGLQRTSPVAATLLVATIPVFAAAISAASGRERFTRRTAAGIALALSGIAVLSRFALPRLGDMFVLLNSLSYAVYVVFAKRLLARYGALTVVAWVFGWGALLFAPLGGLALVREAPRWSPGAAAMVAFILAVPTVLAYGLNAWALRRAGPTLVTIYIYLQPLVVVALAWLQLGDPPGLHAVAAGALILGGVSIVVSRGPA